MKKLIIVCGLPVTGKSSLAEGLAKKLRFPLLSVDPIESAIIKAGFSRSFETGLAAYLVAEILAGENLKLNNSVIIDAVSGVIEAKNMWRNLSKKYKAKLIIIDCICSNETTHKAKIKARVRSIHGIPEVKWADVLKRKSEAVAWDEPTLVIDSINDKAENYFKALKYVSD
jgi:predicted kinase